MVGLLHGCETEVREGIMDVYQASSSPHSGQEAERGRMAQQNGTWKHTLALTSYLATFDPSPLNQYGTLLVLSSPIQN